MNTIVLVFFRQLVAAPNLAIQPAGAAKLAQMRILCHQRNSMRLLVVLFSLMFVALSICQMKLRTFLKLPLDPYVT